MFNEDKPFLYDLRMYLFGQKYTRKELCIMYIAFMMWGAGTGVAIPVIIEKIMGASLDTRLESASEAIPYFLWFVLYIIVFYPIFYYISKGIVEIFLFIGRKLRKLAGY